MLRPRHRPSSCRNRTREFRGAVEFASGSLCSYEPAVSEFKRRAAGVGHGIREVSRKIKLLLQRANSASVFDDYCGYTNSDCCNQQGNHCLEGCCSRPSGPLQFKKRGWKHFTRCSEPFNREFNEVLTTRTKILRAHQDRRNTFSSSASQNVSNPSIRQDQPPESIPPAPWAVNSNSNSLLQRQRNKGDVSGQQKQQLAVQQDSYMQSRAGAIQNMESTTNELVQIFRQLATMVSEKEEVAIRIDEDMADTLVNVESAQGQLLKHLNSVSSNRWLMSKIFVVLIIFLLIFVLIT